MVLFSPNSLFLSPYSYLTFGLRCMILIVDHFFGLLVFTPPTTLP
jgi:hypothetical protein